MARRPLIAGNWKMHGTLAKLGELTPIRDAADGRLNGDRDLLVCPPATLLSAAHGLLGHAVAVGGQDCHHAESGAHTGDLAAAMLKDVGASFVIVGHSERRADHGEDDATVRAKAEAAIAAGLTAIVCIGETEAERDAGRALEVIGTQLAGSLPDGAGAETLVVAYEPVWAIGTGRTPESADIREVHGFIRQALGERLDAASAAGVRLLYGGSVKPSNAEEILAIEDVDGALVGGASLKGADFVAIAEAAAIA